MAITLARICANAEKTYGMKLIAGRAGMDNFVRWVHIVEDSEVPDFMHGNELVFTTGIGHKGSGWLLDFVRQLKGKNAAGVVVNIGPPFRRTLWNTASAMRSRCSWCRGR